MIVEQKWLIRSLIFITIIILKAMREAVGGFHARADGSERAHHHTGLKAAAVAMLGRKRQTVGCLIAGAHVNNILFF